MITILLATLLAGLPEVVIADEYPRGGDPSEIKISVTNKTEETIIVSFLEMWHDIWFSFNLFDERGRPVDLPRTTPQQRMGNTMEVRIKPGETTTGYLSPKLEFQIPPGRYQVSVTFRNYQAAKLAPWRLESNRITKTFP